MKTVIMVAAPLLCAATPVAAQQLGGGGSPEVSIVRVIGSLLLCLIVAGLAIFYLRLRQGRGVAIPSFARLVQTSPEIDVKEVRRLTVQHSVCLVRHGAREYLIVLSPASVTVLNEQDVTAVNIEGEPS